MMKLISKNISIVIVICLAITACDQNNTRINSKSKTYPTAAKHQFQNEKTHNLYPEGLNLNKQGKYTKAIEVFNKVEKMESNTPKLYLDRGLSYRMIGDFENSINDYTKAIKLDSIYFEAFSNRGMIYYRLSENKKAINDFNMAIGINSNEPATYLNRGLVLMDNDQLNEACKDWKKAIDLGYREKYDNQIDELINRFCK